MMMANVLNSMQRRYRRPDVSKTPPNAAIPIPSQSITAPLTSRNEKRKLERLLLV
jgi:hypothetical protein